MVEANPATTTMTDEELQQHVLTQLKQNETIADTVDICSQLNVAPA